MNFKIVPIKSRLVVANNKNIPIPLEATDIHCTDYGLVTFVVQNMDGLIKKDSESHIRHIGANGLVITWTLPPSQVSMELAPIIQELVHKENQTPGYLYQLFVTKDEINLDILGIHVELLARGEDELVCRMSYLDRDDQCLGYNILNIFRSGVDRTNPEVNNPHELLKLQNKLHKQGQANLIVSVKHIFEEKICSGYMTEYLDGFSQIGIMSDPSSQNTGFIIGGENNTVTTPEQSIAIKRLLLKSFQTINQLIPKNTIFYPISVHGDMMINKKHTQLTFLTYRIAPKKKLPYIKKNTKHNSLTLDVILQILSRNSRDNTKCIVMEGVNGKLIDVSQGLSLILRKLNLPPDVQETQNDLKIENRPVYSMKQEVNSNLEVILNIPQVLCDEDTYHSPMVRVIMSIFVLKHITKVPDILELLTAPGMDSSRIKLMQLTWSSANRDTLEFEVNYGEDSGIAKHTLIILKSSTNRSVYRQLIGSKGIIKKFNLMIKLGKDKLPNLLGVLTNK